MNTVFENTPLVKDNSAQVMQFLKYIEKDANHSHELAGIGIHTQLAQSISGFLTDPLMALGQTYTGVAQNLRSILKVVVEQFLKTNREYIEKAYYTNTGFLEYYLILKKDTTKNRDVFFDFLRQYETLDIEESLPIRFMFLPKTAKALTTIGEEISFI